MRKLILLLVAMFVAPGAARADELGDQLSALLAKGMPRLGCNLAPKKAKPVRGADGREIELVPAPGSIVAAPSFDNPDYYFHWTRDSALTVDSLLRLLPRLGESPAATKLRGFLADFARFSIQLQDTTSFFGMGDPRFNVDGSVDTLPWSRPQHDGPALQALTFLRYLRAEEKRLDPDLRLSLRKAVVRDLDHLSYAFEAKSFDLWEISFGHHLFTRLVQLGALDDGLKSMLGLVGKDWLRADRSLRERLADHWDEAGGFYHFTHGSVTDWTGGARPEVGGGLDASIVLAVNETGRRGDFLGLRDSRVLSTVDKVEDHFRHAYALNAHHEFAPAIGRHPDDDYFGGNPWFVLTSGYAEFYYRLARDVRDHGEEAIRVDEWNQAFFERLLARNLTRGANLSARAEDRDELFRALVAKGDGFMATQLSVVGKDGALAEQYSRTDGTPLSAPDLSWSYASVLSAALEREETLPTGIAFAGLSLDCAQ